MRKKHLLNLLNHSGKTANKRMQSDQQTATRFADR